MSDEESTTLDLIDELWTEIDNQPENAGPGALLRTWAQRCQSFAADQVNEERAATLAFLEHAGVSKVVIALVSRGVHRKRSSTVMAKLKEGE